MLTDSYGQSVPYLDETDSPDLNVWGSALVGAITPQTVMRFASASARDATITTPAAGMLAWIGTLLTVYDGSQWAAVAAGTQAWTTPALASGYTADGNSNGIPQYRLVNLFGDVCVMWKGGLGVTYSGGSPVNDGNFLSVALPSGARPQSRRTVSAACSAVSADSLSLKIDFNTDGTVQIVNESSTTPPWVSLNGLMYSLTD